MLATLRDPRYAALSIVMLVVALACVGLGTWQIVRFENKVHANDALRANAHAAPVPLMQVLPLVGAAAPVADDVRLRTVTATGTYDPTGQVLVRLREVAGRLGYVVLTPLTTTDGTLLVARGFTTRTRPIPAPPGGVVTVRARVQPAETKNDLPGGIPPGQVASVNPADQAGRSGEPTFNGYVELEKGQAGTNALTLIPAPSLSNPAGGALEPQHFAYVIQWYLFAGLALAAPFVMARAERREQEYDDDELSDEQRRAAKLADRYGRSVS